MAPAPRPIALGGFPRLWPTLPASLPSLALPRFLPRRPQHPGPAGGGAAGERQGRGRPSPGCLGRRPSARAGPSLGPQPLCPPARTERGPAAACPLGGLFYSLPPPPPPFPLLSPPGLGLQPGPPGRAQCSAEQLQPRRPQIPPRLRRQNKSPGPGRPGKGGAAKPTPAALSSTRTPKGNPRPPPPGRGSPNLCSFGPEKEEFVTRVSPSHLCVTGRGHRDKVAPVSATRKEIPGRGAQRRGRAPRSTPRTPYTASSPLPLKLCLKQQLKHN